MRLCYKTIKGRLRTINLKKNHNEIIFTLRTNQKMQYHLKLMLKTHYISNTFSVQLVIIVLYFLPQLGNNHIKMLNSA